MVNIGLRSFRFPNHLLARRKVCAFKAEKSKDHLKTGCFGSLQIVNSIRNKFRIQSFEQIFVPELELLVSVEMDPLTDNVGTTGLVVVQVVLEPSVII